MQTAPDTNLLQLNNWTLRTRPATHRPTRLLLLLHGLTGDENSMWVFARDLPRHYEMLAPRAPHPTQPGGYSWRPFTGEDFGRPTLDQLRPAAEALMQLIAAYQASAGVEAPEFDVVGFSQGAAMTSLLSMLYPERIRKIGILAGFVPAGLESVVEQRPLAGKDVFVAHGTKDTTVPVDRARASIAVLEQAGAHVTYCEDEVGHKVSLACLQALRHYLTAP